VPNLRLNLSTYDQLGNLKTNASGTPVGEITSLSGSGTSLRIGLRTAAAADTGSISIGASGNSPDNARGASVIAYGVNHATTPGQLALRSVSPGTITLNGAPFATAVGDAAFLTSDVSINATTARSSQQRWSDTINVMDYGADPGSGTTPGTATFHTILENCVAEAKARNCSEIRIPPGRYRLGDAVDVDNFGLNARMRIIGCAAATRISANFGDRHWFNIGIPVHGSRTTNIIFEDLTIETEASVPMLAGTVFNLRQCTDMKFTNCRMIQVRSGFWLGVGPIASGAPFAYTGDGDVLRCEISDCSIAPSFTPEGSPGAFTGAPTFLLGGAGSIIIRGGCYNAGMVAPGNAIPVIDQDFIRQTSDTTMVASSDAGTHSAKASNIDGLYLYAPFCEDYHKYVNVRGAGIGNLIWIGGQLDGYHTAIDTTGASIASSTTVASANNSWQFIGAEFNSGYEADEDRPDIGPGIPAPVGLGRPCVWGRSGGGITADGLLLNGCSFGNTPLGPRTLLGSTACFIGNIFRNYWAEPIIEFGGKGSVAGNTSFNPTGVIPTSGIEWTNGPFSPERASSGNTFIGVSAANQEVGPGP
jgi:hypothetical protein